MSSYIDRKVEDWSSHYHLKKRHASNNEWAILCPFHGDTQQSLFINRDTGKWYCFGCSSGSSKFMVLVKRMAETFGEEVNYDEAKESGFTVGKKEQPKVTVFTGIFDNRGREYFLSRGFTMEDIDKLTHEYGLIFRQMRINDKWFLRFDILDFDRFFVGYVRRSITGDKGYFYKTGYDSERYFYGEWILSKEATKIVIVEGVFDYFKVRLAGYPCLAVLNFSKASLKLARLIKHLTRPEFIYLFDSDVNDQTKKAKAWIDGAEMFNTPQKFVNLDSQWDDPGSMTIGEIRLVLEGVMKAC